MRRERECGRDGTERMLKGERGGRQHKGHRNRGEQYNVSEYKRLALV